MFHLLRIVVKNGRLVTFRKFSIMENLKKASLAWKMKIKEILIEENLEKTSLVWKEKDRVDDFPLEKVSIALRLFLFSKPGNCEKVEIKGDLFLRHQWWQASSPPGGLRAPEKEYYIFARTPSLYFSGSFCAIGQMQIVALWIYLVWGAIVPYTEFPLLRGWHHVSGWKSGKV